MSRSGLRAGVRRLRAALAPMRARGHALANAALVQLPVAVMLRAWRVLAQPLNARLLARPRNIARVAAFQDSLGESDAPRLYVIVMPHTLHFLLPCLALVNDQARLVLIANGARAWEIRLLRQRFPELALFELPTLPGSSVAHGDVLSLLLEHQRGSFGIVDHDAYVFDPQLLRRMQPAAHECLVGVFEETSRRTGLRYPLTHLLYFNAEALRGLMHRHGVDARLYRSAPAHVAPVLARLGLSCRSYLKDHHDFFDTLHVLLAVALAEGLQLRVEPQNDVFPVMHVGGTSIGSHHTKSLFALYTHLRFIELLDDPQIRTRYGFLTRPLKDSADALARRDPYDPGWQGLPVLDALIQRLTARRTPPA